MALRDKKFLLVIACLVILASCGKKPEEIKPTIDETTQVNTESEDEKLIDEINKALENDTAETLETPAEQTGATETTPTAATQGTTALPPGVTTEVKAAQIADIIKKSDNFVKPEEIKPTVTINEADAKVSKLTQTYKTPGGMDQAEFGITVENGNIAFVTIKTIKGGEISQKMMASFGENINRAIAGRPVAEALNLVAVGGASLTTKAFVEAVKTLK